MQRFPSLITLTGSLSRPRLPQEKNRPPRTPLEPTFQNDKSLIDTQSDSLCTSEPRGSRPLSQPLRRTYAAGACSIAFCCSSTVFTSGSWPASRWTSLGKFATRSRVGTTVHHKERSLLDSQTTSLATTVGREIKRAPFGARHPPSSRRCRPTQTGRLPAPRSLLSRPPVISPTLAIPPRGFFVQSPRRQLKSAKT